MSGELVNLFMTYDKVFSTSAEGENNNEGEVTSWFCSRKCREWCINLRYWNRMAGASKVAFLWIICGAKSYFYLVLLWLEGTVFLRLVWAAASTKIKCCSASYFWNFVYLLDFCCLKVAGCALVVNWCQISLAELPVEIWPMVKSVLIVWYVSRCTHMSVRELSFQWS